MNELTVVIPFATRKHDKDCLLRLKNAVACFDANPFVDVLVYDTTVSPDYSASDIIRQQSHVRYVHNPQKGLFSPGKVRNLAVGCVETEYLLFFDGDHLCSPSFIDGLPDKIKALKQMGPHAFLMFPFLYLTRGMTASFSGNFSDCLDSYLKGENHKVEAIALSTCCLLLNRQHFLDLGGFNESYRGHGCEDFDLVHKLCTLYPSCQRPADYYLDEKQRFPVHYQGFRRYFAYFALPHLFTGDFVLHQWHPRPPIAYHKQRNHNEALLQEEMRRFDVAHLSANGLLSGNLPAAPEMEAFITDILVQHGYSPDQYPGLFHWQKGVREHGVFTRKLNKFLRDPLKFVKDSKLGRRCLARWLPK